MTSKTQAAATEMDEAEEDTQKDKYLTFHLGSEDYGIEIRHVTEIIGIQKITVVPEMPEFIKGVINLRGKIIPVMDVRSRFRLPARAYDERTCVIVVEINESAVGLVVDTVSEVADIPESQIESAAGLKGPREAAFIQGIGKIGDDIKIILDVNRLLFNGNLGAQAGETA
ncbi:MAG TPA: chemotaxis protein CheW [Fibrobacteria bacterium]|nr:chemotaxis protein CheW [Fibrobacteria bacterium]